MELDRGPRPDAGTPWAVVVRLSLAGILLAVVLVALVALLGARSGCGCLTPAVTPPRGALTQSEAIQTALRVALPSASSPSVVWAQLSWEPFASEYDGSRRLVWLVRLEGDFQIDDCGPTDDGRYANAADEPCLDREGGIVTILDAYSGHLLGWTH